MSDKTIRTYECTKCQKVHREDGPLYATHLGFQSKHGMRYAMAPPVNPDAFVPFIAGRPAPVIEDPNRPINLPSFVQQINEATTLGQLQIVIACLNIDMRWWFRQGRYHCRVFSKEESGSGMGDTLPKAIQEAIGQYRGRLAVRITGEGTAPQ